MKSGFDVTNDVRSLINVPAIISLLGTDGKIYQTERPTGRGAMTDIVINCLGITNDLLQKGSGNVNVYVPTLASGTQRLADQAKMNTLSKAVISLIDMQFKASFQTWIDELPTVMQDTDGSYFLNIPFEYQAYNKNYN